MSAPERFDGAAAWARIPPDDQALLGGALLEMELSILCASSAETAREERPYRAAEDILGALIGRLIEKHCPEINNGDPAPLPSCLGPICRQCGCSQLDACMDATGVGCHWAATDLCSACANDFAEPLPIGTAIVSIDGENDSGEDDQPQYTGPNAVGRIERFDAPQAPHGYTYDVSFPLADSPGDEVWVRIYSSELRDPTKYTVPAPKGGAAC